MKTVAPTADNRTQAERVAEHNANVARFNAEARRWAEKQAKATGIPKIRTSGAS